MNLLTCITQIAIPKKCLLELFCKEAVRSVTPFEIITLNGNYKLLLLNFSNFDIDCGKHVKAVYDKTKTTNLVGIRFSITFKFAVAKVSSFFNKYLSV